MIANRFVAIETTRAGHQGARPGHGANGAPRRCEPFRQSSRRDISSRAHHGLCRRRVRGPRSLAATEFVQGRSLKELFQGEPCHPRRAAEIVSELADGVAELHSRGLTHGNITESAALLTAKGKARLSLTSATGGDELLDVDALKLVLKTIGGQPTDAVDTAQSAAVLAAALRS